MHSKQMHKALHQAKEEHAVLDGGRTRRTLDIADRVVEEDKIQVGPVPELVAAELAVGDDDQAGRHGARLAASLGLAVARGDLHPGEIRALPARSALRCR
jgi:hypothetical protein